MICNELNLFIQDGTNTPRLAAAGWMPPADIGAKPLSVTPRGGFILFIFLILFILSPK
jgi:hypothetical protein